MAVRAVNLAPISWSKGRQQQTLHARSLSVRISAIIEEHSSQLACDQRLNTIESRRRSGSRWSEMVFEMSLKIFDSESTTILLTRSPSRDKCVPNLHDSNPRDLVRPCSCNHVEMASKTSLEYRIIQREYGQIACAVGRQLCLARLPSDELKGVLISPPLPLDAAMLCLTKRLQLNTARSQKISRGAN